MRTPEGIRLLKVAMIVAMLLLAGCQGGQGSVQTQGWSPSARGPGMKLVNLDQLRLPAPSGFEFSYVDPAHFAPALGNDPVRIFEFLRNHVAFEAYVGLLRGPRGTLLAMAGNSLDRAVLLGTLLRASGQTVRYARGTLPEREAQDLVTSMWAERPRPTVSPAPSDPVPHLAALSAKMVPAIERDYRIVRDQLSKTKLNIAKTAPTLPALVKEAQTHYWVQWVKDGAWTDLDPSFGDATIGRAYARAEETFETPGEELFHRVTFRLRIEEYADKPTTREVLTYRGKATDLSGLDLVLTHVPENWTGPARSLGGALAGAVGNTGRIKPVLIAGDQVISGEPFRQKPKTTGLGGLGTLLGGEGTRKPLTIASAEWLEIEWTAPGGARETVVREIFDLAGKARRGTGQILSADELQTRAQAENAFDLTAAAFDLFLTTGRLDEAHVALMDGDGPDDQADVRTIMRRVAVMFTLVSDGLLRRVGKPDRAVVLFYPDSPRLQIVEIYAGRPVRRFGLDLRQDKVRAVVLGPKADDLIAARVLRGVVNGTIERLIVEAATSSLQERGLLGPVMSTSLVFERATEEHATVLLLPQEKAKLDNTLPEDTLVRIAEEANQGMLAIAPRAAVQLRTARRFAWWRVDPATGDTIGVTDEGLHQGATESSSQVGIIEEKVTVGSLTFQRFWVIVKEGTTVSRMDFPQRRAALYFVWELLSQGYRWVESVHPSWLR